MANLATATCEAERQTGQAPIVDMLKPVARQQVCVAGNVGSVVDHAGGDAVGLQLAHQLLRVVLRRPCADQFVERVMCRLASSGIRIARKGVGSGKSVYDRVDSGGGRNIKKKK